jgi:hypothetical protein
VAGEEAAALPRALGGRGSGETGLRARVVDGLPLVLTLVSVTAALCAIALNVWAQSRGQDVWRLYYADVGVGLTFPAAPRPVNRRTSWTACPTRCGGSPPACR